MGLTEHAQWVEDFKGATDRRAFVQSDGTVEVRESDGTTVVRTLGPAVHTAYFPYTGVLLNTVDNPTNNWVALESVQVTGLAAHSTAVLDGDLVVEVLSGGVSLVPAVALTISSGLNGSILTTPTAGRATITAGSPISCVVAAATNNATTATDMAITVRLEEV